MSYKLGEYLKMLRGKESLRSVSDRTNGKISHNYISELEKGISNRGNRIKPSPETLRTLASVYDTDYGELMDIAGYSTSQEAKKIQNERIDLGELANKILKSTNGDSESTYFGEPSTIEQKNNLRVALSIALELNKQHKNNDT